MKRQKQIERLEENVKSQMSSTLRAPYMSDKSRKLLEQRDNRLNSQQRSDAADD